tara:strand:- start:36 stop:533 length:498 start_codon:yes stop_codon:yes gene_type:complete
MIVTIFQSQVTKVWRSKISNALINKNKENFKYLLSTYLGYSTLILTLIALFFFLFSNQIVTILFKEEYILLVDLLPIFSVFFIFINLEALSGIFWISIGDRREYLIISLFFSIALIIILETITINFSLKYFALIILSFYACSIITLFVVFYFKYLKNTIFSSLKD